MPKTILIVDDSKAVRHAVRAVLEQQADLVVCGEAVDGVDAIKKTEKLKPDLIVLDLVMPKLNGAAAASVLRRTVPSVQIILFTMYEEAVDALASAIGVDVVLSKPDGLSNLVQRVRDVLDSRRPFEQDHPVQHSPHKAGPKVLVVEDFDRFRQFVVSMLHEKPGFQVTQASDGLEAVRRAEEQRPDLVLLDIGLPGLHGLEVARRLRRLAAPPKIVFLSQESSPEVVGEAMYLGALGYVQKQRAGGDLMPAIEAALKGSRFVSSSLQVGQGVDDQAQSRHEILFYSDEAALLNGLAHFVVNALNSDHAAIVRATISRLDSLHQELRARGIDIEAAIRRGIYVFLDVDEPPDRARIPDAVRRLSEAASKAGKRYPRVAVYSERTGRLWAEGKTHEAIQLEQRANELAKRHNVDILCPYALPHGQEDHSAFKSVCTQHSAVSFR